MRNSGDNYHIAFVEDGVLPDGVAYTFNECDGELWLVYNEAKITPEVLAESWWVYRVALDERESVGV